MAGWVTEPPIYTLTWDAYCLAVQEFIADMRRHGTARSNAAADTASESLTNEDNEKYVYRYATRLGAILPLAVMSGSVRAGAYYLEYFATNPSAEGSGGIMMEFAVNRSQAAGRNGIIELSASSAQASAAYDTWGFVFTGTTHAGTGRMRLDPNTGPAAAKWSRVGDRWRLTKYAALTRYAA